MVGKRDNQAGGFLQLDGVHIEGDHDGDLATIELFSFDAHQTCVPKIIPHLPAFSPPIK